MNFSGIRQAISSSTLTLNYNAQRTTHSINLSSITIAMAFYKSSLEALSPSDAQLFEAYGRGKPLTSLFPTVHAAIFHHARQNQHSIAVRDLSSSPPRTVTYGTLVKYSRFLAVRLR